MPTIQPEVNAFIRDHQSAGNPAGVNKLASAVTNQYAKDLASGKGHDAAKATAVAALAAFDE